MVLNLTERRSFHPTPHLKDLEYSPLLLQCVPKIHVLKWTDIKQTIKIILQAGVVCHQVHCHQV